MRYERRALRERGHRRARTALIAGLACTIGLSGCTLADDAGRIVVAEASQLERSRWLPRGIPRSAQWPSEEAIRTAAIKIARPISADEPATQKAYIAVACEALAAEEVVRGKTSASDYVISHFKIPEARRIAVRDLVNDLQEARSIGDAADKLGTVALCEWAAA